MHWAGGIWWLTDMAQFWDVFFKVLALKKSWLAVRTWIQASSQRQSSLIRFTGLDLQMHYGPNHKNGVDWWRHALRLDKNKRIKNMSSFDRIALCVVYRGQIPQCNATVVWGSRHSQCTQRQVQHTKRYAYKAESIFIWAVLIIIFPFSFVCV